MTAFQTIDGEEIASVLGMSTAQTRWNSCQDRFPGTFKIGSSETGRFRISNVDFDWLLKQWPEDT